MSARPFPGVARTVSEALRHRLSALVEHPEGGGFVAATLGTELAQVLDSPLLERLAKPAIAPTALAGALRPGLPATVDTALLGVAGVAYTIGDVILMLGEGHSGRDHRRLVAGATAFGTGHLALGAVLLRSGVRPRAATSALHAVAASGAAFRLFREDGRAAATLAAYAGILASLSALATSVDTRASDPADPSAALLVGGPLFVVSDSLILVRRAVPARTLRAQLLDVSVIDTYALAALLLLSGGAAAARSRRTP